MWVKSLDILEFQISEINKNRHYNKFSLFSYRNKSDTSRLLLASEDYFQSRVANNLFYGLEEEYKVIPYLLPKTGGSRRNSKYLSYPLQAIHNAIGVYLLNLTKGIQLRVDKKHIFSLYGADLERFYEAKKPDKCSKALFYLPYYKRYQTRIHSKIKEKGVEHRVGIYFDIKDFFDEMPIDNLLHFIDVYVEQDAKQRFSFDQVARAEIEKFYLYLQNGKGIPQHEFNVFSQFVGNLYLQFANMKICDIAGDYPEFINNYQIVQYVDDTWLFLDFNPSLPHAEREQIASEILERVIDDFINIYKLRLSPKTKIFWLNEKDAQSELASTISMTSLEYASVDEEGEDSTSPNELLDRVFDTLQELKDVRPSRAVFESFDHKTEILNNIYKKGVAEILNRPSSITRLEAIFKDFNFDLVKCSPLALCVLINKVQPASSRFRNYLLQKRHYSSYDIIVAFHYLSQRDFSDPDVLTRLGNAELGKQLISDFHLNDLPSNQPGYFDLPYELIHHLHKQPEVIKQVGMRQIAERRCDYSASLSHLVNEFHAICYTFDPNAKLERIKNYNQEDVSTFLQKISVPASDHQRLTSLYSGRHGNTISHAGSPDEPVQVIFEHQYKDFRLLVGRYVRKILEFQNASTISIG
jgi:AbiA family abortive infection protein